MVQVLSKEQNMFNLVAFLANPPSCMKVVDSSNIFTKFNKQLNRQNRLESQ